MPLQLPSSSSRGPPSIFNPGQVQHYHHYSQGLPYCCQPRTGQVEAEMYEKNVERLGERGKLKGKQHWRWQRTAWWFFCVTSSLLNLLWADTQPLRCMSRFLPESSSPLRDRELVSRESKAH